MADKKQNSNKIESKIPGVPKDNKHSKNSSSFFGSSSLSKANTKPKSIPKKKV
ncbi:MAG: hypothetical protein KBF12_02955 [Sebaldella sp.]|nr:hypothetical protein [Sebaldella sp.]